MMGIKLPFLQWSNHSVVQPYMQTPPVTTVPVFFHMHLVDMTQTLEVDTRNRRATIDCIESGKTYILHLSAARNPQRDISKHPMNVPYGEESNLVITSNHKHVHIDTQELQINIDNFNRHKYGVKIQIDTAYAGDSFMLEVSYKEKGTGELNLTSRLLFGTSEQIAGDYQDLERIVLDAAVVENTRVLFARSSGSSKMYLCSYWDEAVDYRDEMRQPSISPMTYMQQDTGERWPEQILRKIKDYSIENIPTLSRWLKSNLRRYGNEFCLIIVDKSLEYHMAWELIHIFIQKDEIESLPDGMSGQVPIGALFPVVRWVPDVRFYEFEGPREVKTEIATGSIVANLDHGSKPNENALAEQKVLTNFQLETFNEFGQFSNRLKGLSENVGLVYMSCHGTPVVDKIGKSYVLRSLSGAEEVHYYDFADLEYMDPSGKRPVVFVNACHSAWMYENELGRQGLPLVFLRSIASGFIGTIGPVRPMDAKKMVSHITDYAKESSIDISIAKALYLLRSEAARRWLINKEDESCINNLLFTFLYVYYGNPYTTLRLLPPSSETDEVVS